MKKILTILILLQLVYSASNAQIKLIGNITTNGKASYPTHIDSLGKGGMMVMPTVGSRDSIPSLRRKFGMLVYVQENDSLYKLKNTASAKKYTDNSDWVTIGLNSTADVDKFLKYVKTSDSLFIIGNTTIDSNLYVKGGLRIGGKLQLDSGLVFKDSLTVTRGARIDSSLILKGKLLLRDSLVASGNGLIKGKAKLDSTLFVNRVTTLNDSLNVKGRAQLDSTLFVNKVTSLNDSLYVKGKVMLDSTLTVNKVTTLRDSLNVKGIVRLDSSLFVKSTAVMNDSLIVKGESYFLNKINLFGITIGAGPRNDLRNTGVGYQTFLFSTGESNDAFGAGALYNNTTGSFNSGFGSISLSNNSTGSFNTSFGGASLYNNLADSNAAFGYRAGLLNTTGKKNTFIGTFADADSVNLINATAIGAGAIVKNSNTLQLGNTSLNLVNTSGSIYSSKTVFANKLLAYDSLIVKGAVKLDSNLYVSKDLFVGGKLTVGSGLEFKDSLLVSRGARIDSSLLVKGKIYVNDSLVVSGNGLIKGKVQIDSSFYVKGTSTFDKHILVNTITIGNGSNYDGRNTGVGYQILRAATTGYWNDAFGNNSMFNLTNGAFNSSFGGRSMYTNVSGNGNASFGYQSLFNNLADSNAAFGYNAGFKNTTGINNTFIGRAADADSVNLINATAIGAGAIVKNSNTLQLGNTSLGLVNTSGSINSSKTIFANKLLAYDSLIVKGNAAISGNLSVKGINILSKFSADSTTMLNNLIDSSNDLSDRINLKVNIADTASMLTNRIQRDTSYLVQKSDTAAMLNSRFAKDTVSLSNRIDVLANSTSSEKIKFTKDFPVRIAAGKTFGKYANGSTVPATGKTLDELLTDITTEVIHPSYSSPSVSVSSPEAGTFEIGSNIGTINLASTYTQRDAGAVTSTKYQKSGVDLAGTTDIISSLITPLQYTAVIQYAKGAVKLNNLDVPDSTNGIIQAGTITSGLTTLFIPAAKKYFGSSSSNVISDADLLAGSSEFVASNNTSILKSSFTIPISGGSKYIYYAYPVKYIDNITNYPTSVAIWVGGFESTGSFTQGIKSVKNAQNFTQDYYIYVWKNTSNADITNIEVK